MIIFFSFANMDFLSALNSCNTVEEWETLTGNFPIPQHLVREGLERYADLTMNQLKFEVW